MVVLESRFDVLLPDESLTPMLTVGELCALIDQYAGYARKNQPRTESHEGNPLSVYEAPLS